MTKDRPKFYPGIPCPDCSKPLLSKADCHRNGRWNMCRKCGRRRENKTNAARLKEPVAKCPCGVEIHGSDRRLGGCQPCREKATAEKRAARKCVCGASMAGRSKGAKSCERCTSQARSKGATKGNAAVRAKVPKVMATALRAVPSVESRPAAQAWPGLRGKGGEWEKGPTSVQGWATLDGGWA